jgi:hypothetical protein
VSTFYLTYDVYEDGFIDNWLLAGPLAEPVPDLGRFASQDFKVQIARHYYNPESEIPQTPQEWEPPLTVGDETLRWRYVRCLDDHFIDLSAFHDTCHYVRAWAYAELRLSQAQETDLVLTTSGPADLWLNGQHIHRHERFSHQEPCRISLPTLLEEGPNRILIRFEEVGVRESPYFMALRVVGLSSEDALVMLPTPIEAVARRRTLERVIEAAYLDRDIYTRDDEVVVRWADDLRIAAKACVRFQKPNGRISREFWITGKASQSRRLLKGVETSDGPYQVVVMPHPKEYYEQNQRVRKTIGLQIVNNTYSQARYGTYEQRRREALEDAAGRSDAVFAEIAKMELGRWSQVDTDLIIEAVERTNQRRDGSDLNMVGLLGVIHRYLDNPDLPEKLRAPLEECVLGFKYWRDEPGSDAMDYCSESHQILFHTCEILAGQLYPDRVFGNAGRTGRWHQERGEQMASSWLHKRGTGGFRDWDSNCDLEQDLVALAHLADLAESTEIQELATILMDKIFFTMALNSYRGAFGSTHGRTSLPAIRSARLEPTAGITRLMWGMGVFNHHIMGTVSLACAKEYELPVIVPDIAADLSRETWSRERQAGELEEWCDRTTGPWEVNKVTYRTPDYMLCSAQDYRPGERGHGQHIWQATLGPDAVVFVNHPSCMSEQDARRPNFWHGNGVLPRVAQWRDVLIAVHKLPENDWMGFTHAYFPVYAFDEHVLRDGADGHPWAFARKGEGYLAITAAQGCTMLTRGYSAYRELRSHGGHNVWLCHMGRAAQDGRFDQFQESMLALDVAFEGLSVHCATLRGETLAFGWEGPLLVNGDERPITGFKHYENPYCVADLPASQMEVRFNDWLLRLTFSEEGSK